MEGKEISFEASDQISGKDGWLTREGKFFPCNSDQHDTSARFIADNFKGEVEELYRHIDKNTSEIDKLPARIILQRCGYVLLSQGKVLLPQRNITLEQIKALDAAKIPIPAEEVADLSVFFRADFKDDVNDTVKNLSEKIDSMFDIANRNKDVGRKSMELSIAVQTGSSEVVQGKGDTNMDWGSIKLRFSKEGVVWIHIQEMFDYVNFVRDAEELLKLKETGKSLNPSQEDFLNGKLHGSDLSEKNIALAPVLLLGFVIPDKIKEKIEKDSKETTGGGYSSKKHGALEYSTRLHDYGGVAVETFIDASQLAKDEVLELLRAYLKLIREFPRTFKAGKS